MQIFQKLRKRRNLSLVGTIIIYTAIVLATLGGCIIASSVRASAEGVPDATVGTSSTPTEVSESGGSDTDAGSDSDASSASATGPDTPLWSADELGPLTIDFTKTEEPLLVRMGIFDSDTKRVTTLEQGKMYSVYIVVAVTPQASEERSALSIGQVIESEDGNLVIRDIARLSKYWPAVLPEEYDEAKAQARFMVEPASMRLVPREDTLKVTFESEIAARVSISGDFFSGAGVRIGGAKPGMVVGFSYYADFLPPAATSEEPESVNNQESTWAGALIVLTAVVVVVISSGVAYKRRK